MIITSAVSLLRPHPHLQSMALIEQIISPHSETKQFVLRCERKRIYED